MSTKKTTKKTASVKRAPRAKQAPAAEEATSEAAAPTESAAASPSLEAIQARAYQIFRSGANPRDPVADWFQAERELRSEPTA